MSKKDLQGNKYIRASVLFFEKDPCICKNENESIIYWEDALLVIKENLIENIGEYKKLRKKLNIDKKDVDMRFKDKLIMPGFIDTHVHYCQTEIIASYGEQLLPWLEKYTFPTEMKFEKKEHAKKIANFFLKELFKNGTTSAMVFSTVHRQSVDAIFEEANKYNMRLITGKVMMDRNCVESLRDTAEESYIQSEELIRKWHKKDRLLYAITPRFAPTSTKKQLELAGKLKKRYPSSYIQTHLSENLDEISWVKSLFPESKNYLDVYEKVGLITKKSVFAHAIHLSEEEYKTLNKNKASVSFCPSSNLFLGSGLFKIRDIKKNNIKIGLGSDVGAGTSFSMFRTLADAYKVVSLEQNKQNRKSLSSLEAFYQITLGAAKSLSLHKKIGKLEKGYEADFVVIDLKADCLQSLRIKSIDASNLSKIEKIKEKLFVLMTLGDDRNIYATFVDGKIVYFK